jgi:hypothetical protein
MKNGSILPFVVPLEGNKLSKFQGPQKDAGGAFIPFKLGRLHISN